MPITTPRETSAGLADMLTPRASDALLLLIQNYAIAYAHGGCEDIATEIERAIALRLDRIENAGTFGTMSTQAHRTLLDCVLGDVSRPVPSSPLPRRIPGARLGNAPDLRP